MPLLLLLLTSNSWAHLQVLVYGPTATVEIAQLETHHYVTVWDDSDWRAASAEDFLGFDAIVVGDMGCESPSSTDFDALVATQDTWAPAVDGNILVTTLATSCHLDSGDGVTEVMEQIMLWVGRGGTGMWMATGGSSASLDGLEHWGSFTSTRRNSDSLSTIDDAPYLWGSITSTDISGWDLSLIHI